MTLEPQVETVEPQVEVIETALLKKVDRTGPRVWGRQLTWTREHLALTAILLLSAFLGLWGLDRNGYSNEFYAAAVKSMLLNWRNFFFASFDPGGFVTVDKPPLALWIQTISAKIFGFNGVSLLLPEALAGVLGVALLYFMVRRAFGSTAGLIAALVLAVTPIYVVMNRHNNPDSLMVFFLLLAAWAWLRAAHTGRLRWLSLGSLLVGLDFNIKTLEAIVVLPAFYLLYFLLANIGWRKRIVHLVVVTLCVLAISFSWSIAVDLTPASQRPYVGGSTNNTEMNLIFGYNGLGRVEATTPGSANNFQPPAGTNAVGSANTAQPPTGITFPGGDGGGTGPTMGGTPGPLRLFGQALSGEFGWFLPLALLGLIFAVFQTRFGMAKGLNRSRRLQSLVMWGGWMLLYAAVFSMSTGTSHSYYLTALAPAQAALVGIGVAVMWQSYRKGGWQAWFLPVSLAATACFQAYTLSGLSDWNSWLAPVLVVFGFVALLGLGLGLIGRTQTGARRWSMGVVGVTLCGLLFVPTALSIRAVFTAITGAIPSAVPGGGQMGFGMGGNDTSRNSTATNTVLNFVKTNLSGQLVLIVALAGLGVAILLIARWLRGHKLFTLRRMGAVALLAFLVSSSAWWFQVGQAQASSTTTATSDRAFGPAGGGGTEQVNTGLLNYLEANRSGYTYLVAVNSDMSAAPYILQTGDAVMSMGGFSGSDQILTVTSVQQLIKNHTIRYFLVGGQGGPGGGNSAVTTWITGQCQAVNSSAYSSATTTSNTSSTSSTRGFGDFGGQESLYDCEQSA